MATATAQRLAVQLSQVSGVQIPWPVQAYLQSIRQNYRPFG